ncbi:uncharacterized protein M421DRAFT_142853 [Didymella exigua CBS 183.55]|uniref:Uncharacterized protein n=1 Tax=Didymella exigua CBS 183.55 TaxID=1150837 RepID=A0A6A5RKH8_9PLEO|nr:uncharacterized protein M421DRAFT_142853 [Didymella exigua CBS 183.55]KAF1928921.1 hypothetical protein M421DRAFT_142853 [Didymella exigua CBS 183.55]
MDLQVRANVLPLALICLLIRKGDLRNGCLRCLKRFEGQQGQNFEPHVGGGEGLIKSAPAAVRPKPTSEGACVSGASPPPRQLRAAGRRRSGEGQVAAPRHPRLATIQTWIRRLTTHSLA